MEQDEGDRRKAHGDCEPHEREPIFFARGFSKLLVEWDTALRPGADGKPA